MCQKSNGYRDTDPTVNSTDGGPNANATAMKSRLPDSRVGSVTGASYNNSIWNPSLEENKPSNLVHAEDPKVEEALDGDKTVDVGKRRRPYFISAHYLNHAALRDSGTASVVLFEHLLCMLENGDPEANWRKWPNSVFVTKGESAGNFYVFFFLCIR
jgi:hypothetical protein